MTIWSLCASKPSRIPGESKSNTDHLNCELVRPKSLCFCALLQIRSIFWMLFSSACTLQRRILTFIRGCNVTLFTYSTVPVPDSVLYSFKVCLFKSVTLRCTESQEDPAPGIYFNVLFTGISPDLLNIFVMADAVEFP